MGVMSCSRSGCDGIMCDVYVDGVGYVCWECEKEFKDYLKKCGVNPTAEGDIKRELQKFMVTSKDDYVYGKEINVDDFFNEYRR